MHKDRKLTRMQEFINQEIQNKSKGKSFYKDAIYNFKTEKNLNTYNINVADD